MPVQRKFTIIPEIGGNRASPAPQQPVRPMTSKQVQKAYKAATRAPRMSRAEARKQEKLEQERIRKEFEKEKAAAKAKAAREKKKEKEAAEREEKRKKGLPLVNVRPSQDTIAWFVRGNGGGRKRDSGGQQLMPVVEEESESEPEPETVEEAVEQMPATPEEISVRPRAEPPQEDQENSETDAIKKRKIGLEGNDAIEKEIPQEPPIAWTMDLNDVEDVLYDGIEANLEDKPMPQAGEEDTTAEEPKKDNIISPSRADSQRLDIDEFPESLEDDFDLDMMMNGGKVPDKEDDKQTFDASKEPAKPSKPESLPVLSDSFEEAFGDDLELEMMEKAAIAESEKGAVMEDTEPIGLMLPPPRPKSQRQTTEIDEDFGDIEIDMLDDLDSIMNGDLVRQSVRWSPKVLQQPRSNSQDNPRSSRPRTRYEEDLGLRRPADVSSSAPKRGATKPVRRRPSPSPSPPRQAPPMSTQAILFNFDDFFPSSSQQARELDEEPFTQPSPIPPQMKRVEACQREPELELDPEPIPHLEPEPEPEPEAEDEQHEPHIESEPNTQSSSPVGPPRRFFTSSGSHELMALAIQRSRRTAALEAIHQRDQARIEAGMIAKAEAEEKARLERKKAREEAKAAPQVKTAPVVKKTPPRPAGQPTVRKPMKTIDTTKAPIKTPPKAPQMKQNPTTTTTPKIPAQTAPKLPTPTKQTLGTREVNKENLTPHNDAPPSSASQETEYGGDWVDDMALELMI